MEVRHNITVGFILPDIILLCTVIDPMLLLSGNPIKRHEEVLSLQPVLPPKRFDIFSSQVGG